MYVHQPSIVMRFYLIILILISMVPSGNAQYEQVARQGRIWYIRIDAAFLGTSTQILAVEGDTLISGKTYSFVVGKDKSLNTKNRMALMREDTATGLLQIFSIQGLGKDTITYDFSFSQGDTLRLPGYISGSPQIFLVDTTFTKADFRVPKKAKSVRK